MKYAHQNRKLHIDFLRIFACFLVIYNHTLGYHYYLTHSNDVYKIIPCIALSSLTATNVPLFFLLSGALLLHKQESYHILFRKRICRFTLVLLGASGIAYASTHFLYGHKLSLNWFLHGLVSCQLSTPYWFLYAYLAFLFALPFLRKLACQLSQQDILLLILFRLVFSTAASIGQYLTSYWGFTPVSIYGSFNLPFAIDTILFYPLLGFYLEHRLPVESFTKKHVALLLVTLAISVSVSTGFTYHQGIYRGEFTQNYLSLMTYSAAISIYLLVKIVCHRLQYNHLYLKFGMMARKLSALTLGIYLLDPILKNVIAEDFLRLAGESFYQIPLSLVYCFISIVICGTITWLLKKIPFIKNIL